MAESTETLPKVSHTFGPLSVLSITFRSFPSLFRPFGLLFDFRFRWRPFRSPFGAFFGLSAPFRFQLLVAKNKKRKVVTLHTRTHKTGSNISFIVSFFSFIGREAFEGNRFTPISEDGRKNHLFPIICEGTLGGLTHFLL